MKGKRQNPGGDAGDRQRRAGDLISKLVARLEPAAAPPDTPAAPTDEPRPAMAGTPRPRAKPPAKKKKAGPTPAPAGRRSGEGSSSVLPYLSQHLQSKPGDPKT